MVVVNGQTRNRELSGKKSLRQTTDVYYGSMDDRQLTVDRFPSMRLPGCRFLLEAATNAAGQQNSLASSSIIQLVKHAPTLCSSERVKQQQRRRPKIKRKCIDTTEPQTTFKPTIFINHRHHKREKDGKIFIISISV